MAVQVKLLDRFLLAWESKAGVGAWCTRRTVNLHVEVGLRATFFAAWRQAAGAWMPRTLDAAMFGAGSLVEDPSDCPGLVQEACQRVGNLVKRIERFDSCARHGFAVLCSGALEKLCSWPFKSVALSMSFLHQVQYKE